jgi:hypothetical protein
MRARTQAQGRTGTGICSSDEGINVESDLGDDLVVIKKDGDIE